MFKQKVIIVFIIFVYRISLFSQGANFQESTASPKKISKNEATSKNVPSESKKKVKKNRLNLSEEQAEKKKEEIIRVLKYGNNATRKAVLEQVHYFDLDESDELLKLISETALNDMNNSVKIACINTLVEIDPPSEYDSIIKTLKDPSDDVKEAGISAVQKLKIDAASDELLSLIKDINLRRNNNLAILIISTLGKLKTRERAFSFLLSKFSDKNTSSSIKAHIALYFGKIKDMRAEDALIKVASDESEDITLRSYAISSLGKLKSKKAIDVIKDILKKINENKSAIDRNKLASFRTYAITALVNLGDRAVLKELIAYARDDDPKVRIGALKKLSEIDDPFVFELIKYKSVKDPNRRVQGVARKILKDMKQRQPSMEDTYNEKEIEKIMEKQSSETKDEKKKRRNPSRNNYPNTSI